MNLRVQYIREKRLVLFGLLGIAMCISSHLWAGQVKIGSLDDLYPILTAHFANAQDSIEGVTPDIDNQNFCKEIQSAAHRGIHVSIFVDSSMNSTGCLSSSEEKKGVGGVKWIEKQSGTKLKGGFFILDDRKVLFLIDMWITDRGHTEKGTLLISEDPEILAGFQKEFTIFNDANPLVNKKDGNWSSGPIEVSINSRMVENSSVTVVLNDRAGSDIFFRLHQTSSDRWRKSQLTLESDPPLKLFNKSSGSNSHSKSKPRLFAEPPRLFGSLRRGKPWLVMVGVRDVTPGKYRWTYRVESDQGVAKGEFAIIFKNSSK